MKLSKSFHSSSYLELNPSFSLADANSGCFNVGVDDKAQGMKFTSKDDTLDIHVKTDPITKVVAKAINFVK